MNSHKLYKAPPAISVIVAVYDGVKTLQQCIDSVALQSYPNKELIVIDGGSKDGTTDLLGANDSKIDCWISEPDKGIADAWNKGLKRAKGDWICFLGADDFFWNKDVLALLSIELDKVPYEVHMAYTQIMLVSAEGNILYTVGNPWEKVKKRFKQGLCLPHQGVMHRRSLFERNGNFDESFRIGPDYELMLRELKAAEIVFIPEIILSAMRQGGLSSNPSNSIEAMKDVRRAQKIHGQYFPSLFWILAILKIYIRSLIWKLIGEQKTRKLLDFCRSIKRLPPYWTKI